MLTYIYVHTGTFTCTWIHAQIYSCLWTWSHPLMHTAHTFILHSHEDTHSLTHRHIHMNSHKYAHAQHISRFGFHCSWVFIQKTFRKRMLKKKKRKKKNASSPYFFFILAWPFLFSILWAKPFSKCLACINYELSTIIIPILRKLRLREVR